VGHDAGGVEGGDGVVHQGEGDIFEESAFFFLEVLPYRERFPVE
jgi:hypothetical protein